jgi:hypothetical protein
MIPRMKLFVCYMPRPSYPSQLNNFDAIYRRVQTAKLAVFQLPLCSETLLSRLRRNIFITFSKETQLRLSLGMSYPQRTEMKAIVL